MPIGEHWYVAQRWLTEGVGRLWCRLQRRQAHRHLYLRPDAATGRRVAGAEPAGADVGEGVGAPLRWRAFLIFGRSGHGRLQRGEHHIAGGWVEQALQVHHAVDRAGRP